MLKMKNRYFLKSYVFLEKQLNKHFHWIGPIPIQSVSRYYRLSICGSVPPHPYRDAAAPYTPHISLLSTQNRYSHYVKIYLWHNMYHILFVCLFGFFLTTTKTINGTQDRAAVFTLHPSCIRHLSGQSPRSPCLKCLKKQMYGFFFFWLTFK